MFNCILLISNSIRGTALGTFTVYILDSIGRML